METTADVRTTDREKTSNELAQRISGRITSVDFFRGITMFLLIGESTRLYHHIESVENSSVMAYLGRMFSHHEWHGLHFWDLIQPFFMFIVGVAIPFAVANRKRKGDSDQTIFNHAMKRAFLLLFFGWALYCIEAGSIVWRDGHVSEYLPRMLRLRCRCAGCVDEITGEPLLDADRVPADVIPLAIRHVGRYALAFDWSDGHSTGIYPFEYLRALGD